MAMYANLATGRFRNFGFLPTVFLTYCGISGSIAWLLASGDYPDYDAFTLYANGTQAAVPRPPADRQNYEKVIFVCCDCTGFEEFSSGLLHNSYCSFIETTVNFKPFKFILSFLEGLLQCYNLCKSKSPTSSTN